MIRGERGVALITTLLITMIVISVSLVVASLVRGKIRLAKEIQDGLQAAVHAENLLQESLFVLSTHRFGGSGIAWADEGGTHTYHFDNRPIVGQGGVVRILDTHAVFPLWPFDPMLMDRVLEQHGVGASDRRIFLDSLEDWMDADNLKRLNGAEAMAYREMGVGYGPRNEMWQCREELRLVHGMTPRIWEVLRREMTPCVGGGINPLTMPEALLQTALNADRGRMASLLELRRKGHLNPMNFLILFPEYQDETRISCFPSGRLIISVTGKEGDMASTKEVVVMFTESRETPFRIENQKAVAGSFQ